VAAALAVALGASGPGGPVYQACSGGLVSINEGIKLIQDGYTDIVIAGGVEDALGLDPNALRARLTHGEFAAVRASVDSKFWMENPAKASRPFDIDRKGFIPASGAAFVVLESEEHLRARGGKAYAKNLGFANSMDGRNRKSGEEQSMVQLNPERVGRTIFDALKPKGSDRYLDIDAIFAHATSTEIGDPLEIQTLALVFGNELRFIPITAIKSMLGHTLGAAGAMTYVNALIAMQEEGIPVILNLDEVDPKIAELGQLQFVRKNNLYRPFKSGMALGFGFGGYNAVNIFGKPEDDLAVDIEVYKAHKEKMASQEAMWAMAA
jgi:3-oxoacyl-[acyl-carrier-protein] synthase II